MNKKLISLICAISCSFLWGTAFIAQDMGMDYIGPFSFTTGRMFLGFIALIPFFGPFILKVISIPIFYILNAMGWVVSAVAIKKGYVNELSKSRTITLALLVGIIIGYILGNIIPLNK